MEWNYYADRVKMWYFPRTLKNQKNSPVVSTDAPLGYLRIDDISDKSTFNNPNSFIDVSKLGVPYATFDLSQSCSGKNFTKIEKMKMVFNITLCGDWAGGEYVGANYMDSNEKGKGGKVSYDNINMDDQTSQGFKDVYGDANNLFDIGKQACNKFVASPEANPQFYYDSGKFIIRGFKFYL